MEITEKLLIELQNRLKVGNRRGVHLNAVPARSRYKFDLTRLSHIDQDLPRNFIQSLLTEQPLKFKISWKDNVPDLNSLFEEDQTQLVKITKSFENLINQTDAIESEKGINTFGFGFPILVRRDQSDNKLTVAPILIWSLRIKRTREFNTWEILRSEDDPIYINEVLINHLQNDAKVTIEQISNELLDDGLIDKNELLDICTNLISNINSSPPSNLRENFSQKLDNIKAISSKQNYEALVKDSNNSLVEFGGLFSIFEVQKENIIQDYENLLQLAGTTIDLEDLKEHYFQPISSVETDPSQQGILSSLGTKRNILIQGPPGTGKSQTLTAILVNALENHKKTIVVCEKRTALEVLEKSLQDLGLTYLSVLIKDIVKERKIAVDSVRYRVDNIQYIPNRYDRKSLNEVISRIDSVITKINTQHKIIDKKILGDKNWTNVVGAFLKELKDNSEDFNLKITNQSFEFNIEELNELSDIIREGQFLYENYKPQENLSFLNTAKLIGDNPYLIEQNIKNSFSNYKVEIETIQTLLTEFYKEYDKIRIGEVINEISNANTLINTIEKNFQSMIDYFDKIEKKHFEIRNKDFNSQLKKIEEDIDYVESLYQKYSSEMLFTDSNKLNSFSFKIKYFFSKKLKELKKDSELVKIKIAEIESILYECNDIESYNFGSDLEENKRNFFAFLKFLDGAKINIKNVFKTEVESLELNTLFEQPLNYQKCFDNLKRKSSTMSENYKSFLKETHTTLKEYEHELTLKHKGLQAYLNECYDLKSFVLGNSIKERQSNIHQFLNNLKNLEKEKQKEIAKEIESLDVLKKIEHRYQTKKHEELIKKLKNLVKNFNADNWVNIVIPLKSDKESINLIEKEIKKYESFFNHESDLFLVYFKWFQFFNSLTEDKQDLINQLKPKQDWRKTFFTFYLNSMLVNSASSDLPTDDNEHNELEKSLMSLEKEQLKYIKDYWFTKQNESIRQFEQNNPNLSVENLYNKRSSHRHKRLSLRQIAKHDLDLFTTFFPIILTTPDVASNLFKGKNEYFDIVMFDEASQLKLEDNLPALLKGKQIIIAGDEHQMPPSNYFSKIFDGSIDDEDEFDDEDELIIDRDNILLSCESLLDFATELSFDKKHLDFHYRSKHPFLIDFSNYAFYNQRLKPLPNSIEYSPIKYIQVRGTYSDHTNDAEAETILSIIENNISRFPNGQYPTIGIATFNIAQRNLIKSKIIDRRKFEKYAEFNEKILELEENGLFVKNLENIQGDERDVIILSTTYGINKDGNFYQRFGPINHKKGNKLLNVIITRAKYKVYVCTSIPEETFLKYKDYLITEGENNRRAVFFAYIAYSKAVSENDDESRIAVLNALSENSNKTNKVDILNADLESPFEEEVYHALTKHFDENSIIPQLQFAGFRIDMVYESKKKGVPKIAIECDGAAYHSSQEAYLYDRHRQKILEKHGFVFHRIYSTNWWRNTKRETKILVDFIYEVENRDISKYEYKSDSVLAFTDNVSIIENEIAKNSPREQRELTEVIRAVSENNHTESFQEKVIVNSKVKVKYLNSGKDIKVQLVEDYVSNNTVQNGVQKINLKSPLGVSLFGKSVGETIKVGNLDNYVEIMEIIN